MIISIEATDYVWKARERLKKSTLSIAPTKKENKWAGSDKEIIFAKHLVKVFQQFPYIVNRSRKKSKVNLKPLS